MGDSCYSSKVTNESELMTAITAAKSRMSRGSSNRVRKSAAMHGRQGMVS
jgi:hypothetical protein